MHRFLSIILLSLPPAPAAQPTTLIPQQRCVWRTGDDPAYAAPALDDSSWRPAAQWNTIPPSPNIWLRCHADLSALHNLTHPAVQITAAAAYELYLNGHLIGRNGNLETGNFSQNIVRSYPVPTELLVNPTSVLALREAPVIRDYLTNGAIAILRAGDHSALDAERARFLLDGITPILPYVIGYLVIGILGIAQLGLYYYDRSRRDLLLLSLVCIGLALLRLNDFCSTALVDFSMHFYYLMWILGNLILIPYVSFFFALARRRVPVLFWILVALSITSTLLRLVVVTSTAARAFWVFFVIDPAIGNIPFAALILTTLAPFVAMLPFSRLEPRMRALGVLCMIWGACDFLYFVTQLVLLRILNLYQVYGPWRLLLLESRALITVSVLLALLLLLFRDQRRVTEERALMAGELQAAREIQRMLAPARISAAPGVKIEVAFRPMRDVGGDFYLCRVLAGSRQRLLVGDVSGKGTAAAMTATLLLGGAEDQDVLSPGDLLAHLDRVLRDSQVGGFATCLCADFAPNGRVTVANAGHLPPYHRGQEIEIESSLPLGLNGSGSPYSEAAMQLDRGDTLTFLSDGVLEARNSQGELFGFDRTREVSTQPAEEIAQAA